MSSERKFIKENVRRQLLKEHLFRETQRAGFGGLDVARTPLGTHITLIAERPGMVIGRRGATINRLTDEVENVFGFDNPQIEVQESDVPALNPGIMAQKLAIALEKGWHFRRAGHSTVMRIMEAGARGCQVEISGKLTGDRHRTVKFRQGHIKYCGEPRNQWMRVAITTAAKKSGVLGLKVSIMDPEAKVRAILYYPLSNGRNLQSRSPAASAARFCAPLSVNACLFSIWVTKARKLPPLTALDRGNASGPSSSPCSPPPPSS